MISLQRLVLMISSLYIAVTSAWTIQQHHARPRRHSTTRMMALPTSTSTSLAAPLVKSKKPHKLDDGRGTFLGFRNVKDAKPALESQTNALMPDGGLSPCVIRVLGVGGGGCNAVRLYIVCLLLRLLALVAGVGILVCSSLKLTFTPITNHHLHS